MPVFENLEYAIYNTTIWDIFKEMELRHPNMIGSPITKMIGKNYVGTILGSLFEQTPPYTSTPQYFDYYWLHSLSPYLSVAGNVSGSIVSNINNIQFQMILNVTPN